MLKLFRKRRADPAETLTAVLGEFHLPSFPALVLDALEKVRDPEAPLGEVANLIVADPGLTVRVLSSVNSPAFGLRHRIRSVHHAASLLGRSQLESILITMAVGRALPGRPAAGFEPCRFWLTAAKRAATARALAERTDPSISSECFTAALLQDLALPMLSTHKPREYGPLLEHWHNSTDDLARLEQGEFGWTHGEIGGAMCESWHFPEAQTRAIAGHHAGRDDLQGRDGGDPLPPVRMVAAFREVREEAGIERVIESSRDELGLAADDVRGLVDAAFEQAREIARLFD